MGAISVPINVKMLGKSMIDAARTAASAEWSEIRPIAEMQLRTLAQAAGEIDDLVRAGQITDERARELFAMHRTAAEAVLHASSRTASSVADVLTGAAVSAIAGRLGAILSGGFFKAGKDL